MESGVKPLILLGFRPAQELMLSPEVTAIAVCDRETSLSCDKILHQRGLVALLQIPRRWMTHLGHYAHTHSGGPSKRLHLLDPLTRFGSSGECLRAARGNVTADGHGWARIMRIWMQTQCLNAVRCLDTRKMDLIQSPIPSFSLPTRAHLSSEALAKDGSVPIRGQNSLM